MDLLMVTIIVNAPIVEVWQYWNRPEHIVEWNFASDDWCCPKADNHLIVNGEFFKGKIEPLIVFVCAGEDEPGKPGILYTVSSNPSKKNSK